MSGVFSSTSLIPPSYAFPSYPTEMYAESSLGAALEAAVTATELPELGQPVPLREQLAAFSKAEVDDALAPFRRDLRRYLFSVEATADTGSRDRIKDAFVMSSRLFFDSRLQRLIEEVRSHPAGRTEFGLHPAFRPQGLYLLKKLELVSPGVVMELANACAERFDRLELIYRTCGLVTGLSSFLTVLGGYHLLLGRLPEPHFTALMAVTEIAVVLGFRITVNARRFRKEMEGYRSLEKPATIGVLNLEKERG